VLLQILGQFVFDILGEAVLGLLLPDWPAAKSPPEEGEWNASLGSVGTAFLLWAFLAIGGALALAAEALARRTRVPPSYLASRFADDALRATGDVWRRRVDGHVTSELNNRGPMD
jgi:hypothetical protein